MNGNTRRTNSGRTMLVSMPLAFSMAVRTILSAIEILYDCCSVAGVFDDGVVDIGFLCVFLSV